MTSPRLTDSLVDAMMLQDSSNMDTWVEWEEIAKLAIATVVNTLAEEAENAPLLSAFIADSGEYIADWLRAHLAGAGATDG